MNARTIALGSLLVIAGITGYRVLRRTSSEPPTLERAGAVLHTVWAGAAFALVVSFLTDIDAELGAAFGTAVATGLAFAGPAGRALQGVIGGGGSGSAPRATAGTPGAGLPAAPPGFQPTPLPGLTPGAPRVSTAPPGGAL